MTENDPPTTPSQSAVGPTPTRWQRMRGAASSRRPQGRAGTVLVGVGGFVLGLIVAGLLLLATPLGGGHGGDGPRADRLASQGPDGGRGGPDGGPGRGGPGRGGADGGPGRGGAGAAGGPVIQVQPGGTVIVQPGATVTQPGAVPAPGAQAPAAPAVPAPAAPAPAVPNGQVPAPAVPAPAPAG